MGKDVLTLFWLSQTLSTHLTSHRLGQDRDKSPESSC